MTSQCEKRLKSHLLSKKCRTFHGIIYPAERKNVIETSSILASGKSRVRLPPPFSDTEVGTRKLEVGSRKSEVGSRKSVVGSQKSEVGSRKSEVGSRKSEVGSRKLEVGSRKSLLGFRKHHFVTRSHTMRRNTVPSFLSSCTADFQVKFKLFK